MSDSETERREDLRKRLSPLEFHVTQERGTEPPFSNRYYGNEANGEYRCICCGAGLFRSVDKYHSGSGWPSFTGPESDDTVVQKPDDSHGMQRTEVICGNCGAHLGHVFEDGPAPTGLRYCINSSALEFSPEEE